MKRINTTLCAFLLAAVVGLLAGCTADKNEASAEMTADSAVVFADGSILGEGETHFDLTVVDQSGSESSFEIHTDQKTVGEALLELGVIDGDAGAFGLYIKTVNGITVDYDKDGKYWAFYLDGEYASAGVDSTEITQGTHYSLKVE